MEKSYDIISKEKVEVLKATKQVIRDCEKTWEYHIPRVLRLISMVKKVFKQKVPYSKRGVFYRDLYTCQYCGLKNQKMTIDHVIPSSRGGKSKYDNCVTSCLKCNTTKNDRTPKEAGMFLLKYPTQPTIMEFMNLKMKSLGMDKILQEIWES